MNCKKNIWHFGKALWQSRQSIRNIGELEAKRRCQKTRKFEVLRDNVTNGCIHGLGTQRLKLLQSAEVFFMNLKDFNTLQIDLQSIKWVVSNVQTEIWSSGRLTIRPCLISTARRRLNVASSLSALSPKGSQKPMGSWTPSCLDGSNAVDGDESPKKFLHLTSQSTEAFDKFRHHMTSFSITDLYGIIWWNPLSIYSGWLRIPELAQLPHQLAGLVSSGRGLGDKAAAIFFTKYSVQVNLVNSENAHSRLYNTIHCTGSPWKESRCNCQNCSGTSCCKTQSWTTLGSSFLQKITRWQVRKRLIWSHLRMICWELYGIMLDSYMSLFCFVIFNPVTMAAKYLPMSGSARASAVAITDAQSECSNLLHRFSN